MDGAGKSRQAQLLADYCLIHNIPYILTKEPGGSFVGEKIRSILLNEKLTPETQLLLFLAARNDHINKKVFPALRGGKVVICDRFFDSTEVYQYEVFYGLHKETKADLLYWLPTRIGDTMEHQFPNLTFIIDIPPEVAIERLKNRGNLNDFDLVDQEEFERRRLHFVQISQQYDNRCILINGNKSEWEVHQDIVKIFEDRNK